MVILLHCIAFLCTRALEWLFYYFDKVHNVVFTTISTCIRNSHVKTQAAQSDQLQLWQPPQTCSILGATTIVPGRSTFQVAHISMV